MRTSLVLAIALLLTGCGGTPPVEIMGAYRLDDGRIVSIRRSVDETLRYRLYESGATGRFYREEGGTWVSGAGFANREPVSLYLRFTGNDTITWVPTDHPQQQGIRCQRIEPVEFRSEGTTLRGQLLLPPGRGPFPAVVLVHGSGDDSAVQFLYSGDFLSANGVAALVFDKRGSGKSDGDFTFDFRQLALDVVAAVDVLAAHHEIDADRIGLCGYSQGGWVAPLAASLDERIAYVSVSCGMIESPSDEATWETQNLLRSRGVDEEGILEATPLIRAAVAVVASGFAAGWDEFHAKKRATEGAAWRDKFDGSPVKQLMRYPKWLTRIIGPGMAPDGLDWEYSSDEVLDSLEIPMTWLLAIDDSSAPNHETIGKLRAYRKEQKPFELVLFDDVDHGMLQFEEHDGKRIYVGYAAGYFRTEVEHVLRMIATE